MSAKSANPDVFYKPHLWHLFIVGRSAVTGVFLALLLIVNGLAITPALRPLLLVATLQFVANGLYLFLWRRQDIVFLGYFCFVLEVFLITLLILAFGPDGNVFVLAYLWPIMIGGWLMGPRLVIPLTLLSSIAYGALLYVQRRATYAAPIIPPVQGLSQALVLSLPYLAFLALLAWALTLELDRGQTRLNQRNQELEQINAKLRTLLAAGEDFMACHEPQALLDKVTAHIQSLTGCEQIAIYAREADHLALRRQRGFEGGSAPDPHQAIPREWVGGGHLPKVSILLDPATSQPAEMSAARSRRFSGRMHIALRSADGLEGMATVGQCDRLPFDRHENQMVQILSHQFGIAVQNARLFAGLEHERNLLQGILGNMIEGVFVLTPEGDVLLANRAAKRLLGIKQGQPLPGWLTQFLSGLGASAGEGEGASQEIEHGGIIVRLTSAALSSEQAPSGTIFVAHDVTEQAQIERMKTDFVAYASHELRTPLTTVKMLVSLLLMDSAPDAKGREYLDMISTQVERQHRLVQNMLDLTRLEAGKYELPLDIVEPAQVVHQVAQACEPLAAEKGVTLRVDMQEGAIRMLSNAGGLEQVLTNLVGNAIKFTDAGGQVTLRCAAESGELRLCVQDTGVGMAPDQLGHLFEKYYTTRHAKKRGEGTGLGLVISQMIVRQLGGHIEVESSLGQGSRFAVVLPLTEELALTP
jgi:signal transduction histidine kinase